MKRVVSYISSCDFDSEKSNIKLQMASTGSVKTETLKDWKVSFWCTINVFFSVGLQRAGALFFVEVMRKYNVNREQASTPFTVSLLVLFLSGPFIGYLGNYFQLRTIVIVGSVFSSVGLFANFWAEDILCLSLCWGLLLGFGTAVAYNLLLEFINRHFERHHSTACGLFFAGMSIGGTVLPYISVFLLDIYTLEGTFLILGGLTLNTIPASMALPVYPKKTTNPSNSIELNEAHSTEPDHKGKIVPIIIDTDDSNIRPWTVLNSSCYTLNGNGRSKKQPSDKKPPFWSLFRILVNPVFIVIGIIQSCFLGVINFLNIIIIDYCMEKGLTQNQGIHILMAVSLTDIVGRVGLGWITDCGFISAVNFLAGSFVLLGVSCLLYIWANGFAMCLVPSVIYGIMFGVVSAYSPKMIKDYIDTKDRTMAVSSRNFYFSPIAVAMPSILGYFKDTVKSYDGLMYGLFAIAILGAVLTIIVPHMAKHQQKSSKAADSNIVQT